MEIFFFNLPEYEAFTYVFKFPGAVELTESRVMWHKA